MSLFLEVQLTEATHKHFEVRKKLSERRDERIEEFERKYDDLKLQYVLDIKDLNRQYGVKNEQR